MTENEPKKVKKLRLNTITNCQNSIARLARQLHDDENPDIQKYRALGYLIKILILAKQEDRKNDFENRLAEIERILNERTLK